MDKIQVKRTKPGSIGGGLPYIYIHMHLVGSCCLVSVQRERTGLPGGHFGKPPFVWLALRTETSRRVHLDES